MLILAVNPGWGSQKFIESTQRRLADAAELIRRSGRKILLGADGGVTKENVARVATMGPNLIVTGSAVFDGKTPADNARYMLDQVLRGAAVTT